MTYSRQAFRKWLEAMPPDEQFCTNRRCPIQVFMPGDISVMDAAGLDERFAWAVDDISVASVWHGVGWNRITAQQCLDVLDGLKP